MFKPKEILAEFIGSFAVIFVVVSATIVAGAGGGPVGTALAGGFALAVVVYIFGHISGGHANPAVTFAMALNGRLKWLEALQYWLAQFVGVILAAFLLNFVLEPLGGTVDGAASVGALTSPGIATTQSYMLAMSFEAILTFLLVAVYMQTVMSGKNEIGGLAYGMTYAFAILAIAPFTGASLNPARSIGLAILASAPDSILGLTSPFMYVVYVVGPLLGATLAVLAYNFFNGIMDVEEDEGAEEDETEETIEKA